MSGKIFDDSRYFNVNQYLENSGEVIFVPHRKPLTQTDFPDNIVHTVSIKDRVDLLSSKYYGTPKYGWVISDFNDLLFPDADLQEKEFVILPSLATLRDKILD